MQDIINKCKNTIKKHNLINKKDNLVLMVSGGCDSVALCYILLEIYKESKKIYIMHLNHQIRNNAMEDQIFVENLAEHLHIKCFSYNANIKKIAEINKQNIEAVGRTYRYKMVKKTINSLMNSSNEEENNFLICSAHTLNDRIENFYMRSIIGTGPGGLAGINYKNNNIIRPLLDINKDEIKKFIINYKKAYIDNYNNLWKEDYTNLDTNRFRAFIRHDIIPQMLKKNPRMFDNLNNTMNLIADENKYLENITLQITDKYFTFNDKSFKIKPGFSKENIVIKRRAIYNALLNIFEEDSRINSKTIYSILKASETNAYTDNIQYNYAVHSNKSGVIVQPMLLYRKNRNRI